MRSLADYAKRQRRTKSERGLLEGFPVQPAKRFRQQGGSVADCFILNPSEILEADSVLNLSEYGKTESQWLSKEDLPTPPNGIQAVIVGVSEHKFENKVKPQLVLQFGNGLKPLPLNPTNCKSLSAFFPQAAVPTDLIGKSVELFNDLSVQFNGTTGGIRLRQAAQQQAAPAQPPAPQAPPPAMSGEQLDAASAATQQQQTNDEEIPF